MNGREILLVLAHLFRKRSNPVTIDDAVHFLSFRCRYGPPSGIRKLLTAAFINEMISKEGNLIKAEFLYNKQSILPNQATTIGNKIRFNQDLEEMV